MIEIRSMKANCSYLRRTNSETTFKNCTQGTIPYQFYHLRDKHAKAFRTETAAVLLDFSSHIHFIRHFKFIPAEFCRSSLPY